MRTVIVAFLAVLAASVAAPLEAQTKKPEALTGCLDEQPGSRYVLRDERQLQILANLEAQGFKTEIFAQYLGQKVTVHGERVTTGAEPVFRVRRIVRVAPSCAPPGESAAPATAPEVVSRNTTATGCVDEQPGPKYVLRSEEQLKLLVELEADGMDPENFARYLGQRVTVHGDRYRDGSREFMKVRKIERLSGSCRPSPQ
jgi:hypothetical protein